MKIDATFLFHDLQKMPAQAREVEAIGFDGLWTAETNHDPFLPLVLAAEHTHQLALGTGIAVAFPRSPAILAQTAWDLARVSQGRFILGLGTQVKAHNVLRLGVAWEKPIAKLREVILAMRAFWDCWQNGRPLSFKGEFFTLKLMTPFFNPGPNEQPHIPIYIAAVNEQMLHLAGSLCEGVHIHALHSVAYLDEVALPQVAKGAEGNGRSLKDIAFNTAVFVIPNDTPETAQAAEAHVRQQISFYLSTPAYRLMAELHGWEGVAEQLSDYARNGRWAEMPALISEEMLDTLAVTGTWAELPHKIKAKYGRRLQRVSYYLPYDFTSPENWRVTVDGFKQPPAGE